MKNKSFAVFIAVLLFQLLCSISSTANDEGKITIYSEDSAHPALQEIEIEMPLEGLIAKIVGKVRLTRKGQGEYIAIPEYYRIQHEDILELSKGAVVSITTGDGSELNIGPYAQMKWFMFKNSDL